MILAETGGVSSPGVLSVPRVSFPAAATMSSTRTPRAEVAKRSRAAHRPATSLGLGYCE
jgi:hypothetical protein